MSTFVIVDTPDREQWEAFVRDHPKGSIFHTPSMMAVFRRTKYHRPLVLAALGRRGQILALVAAVHIQTLPDPLGSLASRVVHFAEPLCGADAEAVDALTALLEQHDAEMRRTALFAEVRALDTAGSEQRALGQCGYAYEDYLNFLIDLRKPAETLLGAMTSDCRRRIRANEKKGLEIRDITDEAGIDTLYRCVQLSYERARVPLAHKSLFVAAYHTLRKTDMIKMTAAYYEGVPVAASVMLVYKTAAFAWYGGSDRLGSVYPMEGLIWREIREAQQCGCPRYDFGGAGWPDKPYGVRDFKAKFGGDLVCFGRYRKTYAEKRLALAEQVYEAARNVINPKVWTKPA